MDGQKVMGVVRAAGQKAKAGLRVAAVASALTLPAFATESGGLTSVTSAADTVTTFVGTAFTLITGNPLLCVYAAAGLVGMGIAKFRQLRRAAH